MSGDSHHCPIPDERIFCESELPCDLNFVKSEFHKNLQLNEDALKTNYLLNMSLFFNILLLVILAFVIYTKTTRRKRLVVKSPSNISEEIELMEIKSENKS